MNKSGMKSQTSFLESAQIIKLQKYWPLTSILTLFATQVELNNMTIFRYVPFYPAYNPMGVFHFLQMTNVKLFRKWSHGVICGVIGYDQDLSKPVEKLQNNQH